MGADVATGDGALRIRLKVSGPERSCGCGMGDAACWQRSQAGSTGTTRR